jgi:hypothetical protein
MFEGSLGRIERDFVISLVSVLQPQVIIFNLDIEERQNEIILDLLPAARGGKQFSG